MKPTEAITKSSLKMHAVALFLLMLGHPVGPASCGEIVVSDPAISPFSAAVVHYDFLRKREIGPASPLPRDSVHDQNSCLAWRMERGKRRVIFIRITSGIVGVASDDNYAGSKVLPQISATPLKISDADVDSARRALQNAELATQSLPRRLPPGIVCIATIWESAAIQLNAKSLATKSLESRVSELMAGEIEDRAQAWITEIRKQSTFEKESLEKEIAQKLLKNPDFVAAVRSLAK